MEKRKKISITDDVIILLKNIGSLVKESSTLLEVKNEVLSVVYNKKKKDAEISVRIDTVDIKLSATKDELLSHLLSFKNTAIFCMENLNKVEAYDFKYRLVREVLSEEPYLRATKDEYKYTTLKYLVLLLLRNESFIKTKDTMESLKLEIERALMVINETSSILNLLVKNVSIVSARNISAIMGMNSRQTMLVLNFINALREYERSNKSSIIPHR